MQSRQIPVKKKGSKKPSQLLTVEQIKANEKVQNIISTVNQDPKVLEFLQKEIETRGIKFPKIESQDEMLPQIKKSIVKSFSKKNSRDYSSVPRQRKDSLDKSTFEGRSISLSNIKQKWQNKIEKNKSFNQSLNLPKINNRRLASLGLKGHQGTKSEVALNP